MKKTPLYNWHISNKGRIVDFAGWALPVSYLSIIDEHTWTRENASVFDICHMGQIFVKGRDSAKSLNALLTNDVSSMRKGQCRYSFMLNDSGTIIDDLIVYRFDDYFMIVVNAARKDIDFEWISGHTPSGTYVSDESARIAKIDLQGPKASLAAKEALGIGLSGLKYYHFWEMEFADIPLVISRTGYTGELGYEFYCEADKAIELWERFLSVDFVRPAGLGARDSLRLEMGYPLYGQDISDSVTPIEAGLDRFVDLDKDFLGKEKMLEKANLAKRMLTGIVGATRRPFRHNDKVVGQDGCEIGIVTSGGYSPSLGVAIGLAYVNKGVNSNQDVFVRNGKGSLMKASIAQYPFYKDGTVRVSV